MVAPIKPDRREDLLDSVLHFDSLDVAEKLTGKDYHDDQDTSFLGFALHIKKNQLKNAMLKDNDDVAYGTEISDYLRIMKELGFVEVLRENFVGRAWSDNEKPPNETFFIYWHPTKFILAKFETYTEKTINSADWYFCFHPNSVDLWYKTEMRCSGFWFGAKEDKPKEEWFWLGHWDSREAIRHQMKKFDNYGHFEKWPEAQLLQLNSYVDWHQCKNHDYSVADKESRRRFNLLPEEVKKVIHGTGRG